MSTARPALAEALDELRLIDHHVHGAFAGETSPERVENALNEGSTAPVPSWYGLDSQLGFAVRAHLAPVLELPRHAPAEDYLARRAELGEAEVNRRMLAAAGVDRWIVDTGYGTDEILSPAQLAEASGSRSSEITRLETVAEELIRHPEAADDWPGRFRAALRDRVGATSSVGVKSVLAYRAGFDVDLRRPDDGSVVAAARRWRDGIDAGSAPRLVDPVLLASGLHAAIDARLPLQLHVGFGDRDLDLHRVDPMLLLDLLRSPGVEEVPVLLLHCYPFERQAGYLAQAFANVYLDVGLAVNYVGARSAALIARSLELAPFGKILYSSDAWGPAELHALGARLWRDGTASVLADFVDRDEWSLPDALRVARMIGRDNALRAYRL